ncbi:DUF3604 domain-containing protein [Halieaceae bacterium IMCC14734]|uniref:DUF3604 domain-containing protein n=1 Tax=Candidatus Litorirhabdus singularis TaxID=2518993 RepID=A0ABT3TC31_9GAMM|nr:DUF3604 domain-containing protein [Candidatus Litorirhabdus singularis]
MNKLSKYTLLPFQGLPTAKSRWTVYDHVRLKAPADASVKLKTQERAYTSPIWYSPAS